MNIDEHYHEILELHHPHCKQHRQSPRFKTEINDLYIIQGAKC